MRVVLLFVLACAGCSHYANTPVYPVSGNIQICSDALPAVKIILESTEYGKKEISTGSDGNFSFDRVSDGSYVLTPVMDGVEFLPQQRTVTVKDGKVDSQDFLTVVSWEKVYGDADRNSEAYTIYQSVDCGYIIAGYKDDSGASTEDDDLWVMKTDMFGEKKWEYVSNSSHFDTAFSAIEDTDGSIVVGGYFDALNGGDSKIMSFKKESATEWTFDWEKNLGAEYVERGFSMDRQINGGFIVGGYATSASGNMSDVWLTRYDHTTNISSSVLIELQNSDEICSGIKEIREMRDSQYYYGYIIAGEQIKEGIHQALLIKADSNFVRKWEKYFRVNGTNEISSSGQVLQTFDNDYVVVGTTAAKSSLDKDAWVARFSSEGEKKWEKLFDYGQDEYGVSICQSTDGCFYVGGSIYNTVSADTDLLIIKIDADGNTLWKKILNGGEGSRDEVKSMIIGADGTLTVAAKKTSSLQNKKQLWLLKFDADGNIIAGLTN